MKTRSFKLKIASAFMTGLMILATGILSGCQGVDQGLDTLQKITLVKTSWESMSADYKNAKVVYAENRAFFSDAEQKTIDKGLRYMDRANAGLKNISESKDAKKLLAIGDFINAYGDGKTGYLLIRSVLLERESEFKTENKALFHRFDSAAQTLDGAVADLKPDGDVGLRVDQLISLISNTSKLFVKS